MGFDIGNGFSGGGSKLCGVIMWEEFESDIDTSLIYGHSSGPISFCYDTGLYCIVSYPFRFSAQRQNSNLELLGDLGTNFLRSFLPTVEPPLLKPP